MDGDLIVPIFNDRLDNIIIIDNTPKVALDKIEKLTQVLRKVTKLILRFFWLFSKFLNIISVLLGFGSFWRSCEH